MQQVNYAQSFNCEHVHVVGWEVCSTWATQIAPRIVWLRRLRARLLLNGIHAYDMSLFLVIKGSKLKLIGMKMCKKG